MQKCDFIEPELVEKSKKKYGYLFEIILNIILGNNERLFTMYCRHFENPDNMRGVNNMYRYPTDPDLDWEKILRRFIYGRRTGHILNISVSNPFYKKYLNETLQRFVDCCSCSCGHLFHGAKSQDPHLQ